MIDVKGYSLKYETIKAWEKSFLTDYEYFFFKEEAEIYHYFSKNAYIIKRNDLANNSFIHSLDLATAYWIWNVDKKADLVVIATGSQFNSISGENQKKLLTMQYQFGRGMFWDFEDFSHLKEDHDLGSFHGHPVIHVDGKAVIAFRKQPWIAMGDTIKKEILIKIAELYTDVPSVWNTLPLDIQERITKQFPQIASLINHFSYKNGPNCFATALAGTSETKDDSNWICEQWLQPDTFIDSLMRLGYTKRRIDHDRLDTELKPGDILSWWTLEKGPVHGAFYVGEQLVFNKNAQTVFVPRGIVRLQDLLDSWRDVADSGGLDIYRKS